MSYGGARSKYLHYDIKPQNIFIRTDHPSGPHGVIGDIDDLIVRNHCRPEEHHITGTPCYGAPFEHCDPRRDQTALLLSIAETLSDSYWGPDCRLQINRLRDDERFRQKLQGWASREPGAYAEWWKPETYNDYAERLESHSERCCLEDNSDSDPAVRTVAEYLKRLAFSDSSDTQDQRQRMESLRNSWNYEDVHRVRGCDWQRPSRS